MLKPRRLSIAGIALVSLAAAAAAFLSAPRTDTVALVDGHPITRAQFNEYAEVLSARGTRDVPAWVVLQSLVNQRLAVVEADRLGMVVTDGELDAAMAEVSREEVFGNPLDVEDVEGFRDRMRVRLLFERVKWATTETVEVRQSDIDAFLAEFSPLYADLDRSDAEAQAEPIVLRRLVDAAWADWLERRRACAEIVVLMGDVRLAEIVPTTGCL